MAFATSSARAARLPVAILMACILLSTVAARHVSMTSGLRGKKQRSTERRGLQSSNLGDGFWSVKGTDFVDSAGRVVYFSGVTWQGFQTPDKVVGGLQFRTIASHLDQMQSLGFNMIRLPFSGAVVNPNVYPAYGACGSNSDLWPLSSLQIMDKIIQEAGNRGMKIILDYHRINPTLSSEWGAWFDDNSPEQVWIDNWVALANRYKGNPTVIGADLFNEVHPNTASDSFPGQFPDGAPFWEYNAGENEKWNFRRATLLAINAIHAVEPNWILFLEGMWQGEPFWWGGNLAEVMKAPITEPAGKIALSAHDYGPFVFPQSWFFAPDFPENLIPIMRQNWGFVKENGIGPLWVGEFGSKYPDYRESDLALKERTTFSTQIFYIKQLGASWTIAFWGPDSNDIGGILNDDWVTPNAEKLEALQGIFYPGFKKQEVVA